LNNEKIGLTVVAQCHAKVDHIFYLRKLCLCD